MENNDKIKAEVIIETNNDAVLYSVRRSFFGVKYLYIDDETRVRYGFSFTRLGITYTLQRKKYFWNEVAWTYPSTHKNGKLDDVINYLKWYEENKKPTKIDCLF